MPSALRPRRRLSWRNKCLGRNWAADASLGASGRRHGPGYGGTRKLGPRYKIGESKSAALPRIGADAPFTSFNPDGAPAQWVAPTEIDLTTAKRRNAADNSAHIGVGLGPDRICQGRLAVLRAEHDVVDETRVAAGHS
jgi:hypothetical protein